MMPLASKVPPKFKRYVQQRQNHKVVFAQSAASNGAQGQTKEQFYAARKARVAKRPCIGMCFLKKQYKLEEEAAEEYDEEDDEEYEEEDDEEYGEEEYEEEEEDEEEEQEEEQIRLAKKC